MSFGERLRAARVAKGYTQEQLAKIIGVAKSTLTGYEKGNREPDVMKIHALASALDITGDELLGIPVQKSVISAHSEDEELLLSGFRSLSSEGQQYMLQTLKMAQATYPVDSFKQERAAYLEKHALPFAAAHGDSSNLDEAQALYDQSEGRGDDEPKD